MDGSNTLSAGLPSLKSLQVRKTSLGSVLTREDLRDRLIGTLRAHPEDYPENLKKHVVKHLESFAAVKKAENGGNE